MGRRREGEEEVGGGGRKSICSCTSGAGEMERGREGVGECVFWGMVLLRKGKAAGKVGWIGL